MPCNDHLLYIGCPLDNLKGLGISKEPFDRIFRGEAIGSKDLDRCVGGSNRDFRGIKFGARDLDRILGSLVPVPCRPMDKQSRSLFFHIHLCDLLLNHLKASDGLAELFALIGVFDRMLQAGSCHSHSSCRGRKSGIVEHGHADLEPVSFFAYEGILGQLDVFKNDLSRRSAEEAEF
jgi:hypothetical protein